MITSAEHPDSRFTSQHPDSRFHVSASRQQVPSPRLSHPQLGSNAGPGGVGEPNKTRQVRGREARICEDTFHRSRGRELEQSYCPTKLLRARTKILCETRTLLIKYSVVSHYDRLGHNPSLSILIHPLKHANTLTITQLTKR
eukprot:3476711-Rhodomonas_salina.1